MAAFFNNQLDFIFFFYGLAFLLVGFLCFAIAHVHGQGHEEPWSVLGLFGFAHGTLEWLDLASLFTGDTPAFAAARTALMVLSYLFLLEFPRLGAARRGLPVPGRWVHGLLIGLIVGGGLLEGTSVANALGRYAIGLVGALSTGCYLAWRTWQPGGSVRRIGLAAAGALSLYGLAAGAIVPAAPIWPATVLNHASFAAATGFPIQLFRGLLACGIAISIWAIWGRILISAVATPDYTRYLQSQFRWTVTSLSLILVLGLGFTNLLGGTYNRHVESAAAGDMTLLESRLAVEMSALDGMAQALAGALGAATAAEDFTPGRAAALLQLHALAASSTGRITDTDKRLVASTGVESSTCFAASPASPEAQRRAIEWRGDEAVYCTSRLIEEGALAGGSVVLERSMTQFAQSLRLFDRAFYFIDPAGIVAFTNRPEARFQSLWPATGERATPATAHHPRSPRSNLFDAEVQDAVWASLKGARGYVLRRFAADTGWSMVIATQNSDALANRFMGLVTTLLVSIMVMIHVGGRERLMRDGIHLVKTSRLQLAAATMERRATTDPLTGVYNRHKLDEVLVSEAQRAGRYGSPLSLVIFDVDHFKAVNDTYGHPVGDSVLIRLSEIAASSLRGSDVIARWGGEEFVILTPGCDAAAARDAAEKLRRAIEQVSFHPVPRVTCSFGVAQFVGSDNAETLVRRADEALYRAKHHGRNRVEVAEAHAPVEQVAAG